MRILLICHSFNSLSQRVYAELETMSHIVSVEYDINDHITREAVKKFGPDLILCPFLKRAIPKDIWENHICIIVHPGIVGDRGPSALDWAIVNNCSTWGVTLLQANDEMDGGDIWDTIEFPMRRTSKSSLYKQEVANATIKSIKNILPLVERYKKDQFKPVPQAQTGTLLKGQWNPSMRQNDRKIDWQKDNTLEIIKKINSGDSSPGVLDHILGYDVHLFGAHHENELVGPPKEILAQRNGALCVGTLDGAVWITHLKRKDTDAQKFFKLPATMVTKDSSKNIPISNICPFNTLPYSTWKEIYYEEQNNIGYLHFNFYNGAMGTEQCKRLLDAYKKACLKETKCIVLCGGKDFWSNGIHLNLIEESDEPAQESLNNILALNDLIKHIINTSDKITVSAIQANAAAGGAIMALASDFVWAQQDTLFNFHYKNMGGLYGSEYWTYLLPKRCGTSISQKIINERKPMTVTQANSLGLVDKILFTSPREFLNHAHDHAIDLIKELESSCFTDNKRRLRQLQEEEKPLDQYRSEELQFVRDNFFGFDTSYHVARFNFVHKTPNSKTPLHLASHRSLDSEFKI